MTKARRMMEENIKLIDLVIELVDARAPLSSRNPDIDNLARGKARLILMNKADLADKGATAKWKTYFEDEGFFVVVLDSRKRDSMGEIKKKTAEACKEKKERDLKRGIKNRPVRAMVCGIPNVGKSTFINSFAKKAVAKTGNKPGVTKGKQWIRLDKDLELLDTPGILWPKLEDERAGLNLALLGSMNDEVLDNGEMACSLIDILNREYPDAIRTRFFDGEGSDLPTDANSLLSKIAVKRGCLKTGNEPDTLRAASLILDELRSGKLGLISLERPEDIDEKA